MANSNASKWLNVALWVVQSLLAAMFLMAGGNKLFQSIPELLKMLPWVSTVPEPFVRFIGMSELLGGIGLLLPSVVRIKPGLTPWAAFGLALVMLLASTFHLSRGESSVIGINLLLMTFALFIAWGRTKKAPILPKN